jgi:uncharacterized delta-60 repeat protein
MLNEVKFTKGVKTILFIILIALTVDCSSQIMPAPSYINQLWKAEYNGTGNESDDLVAIATDDAGNVFVTGSIEETNNYTDWATIKYSPSGVRLWVAKYNNGDVDIPHGIALDNSGNVYVTGESYSTSNDYLTIKYNSSGVKQWERRFGGTGEDIAYGIAVDANSNVYVTGSAVHGTGNTHCVTVKYNSAGDLQWEADYNGSYGGNEKGLFIEFGRNGAVYIAGVAQNTDIYKDVLLIKYNTSGEEHWVETYDGAGHGHDIITKMVVGENQHIYLSGYTYGETTGRNYLTMNYNGLGQRIWAKTYNGPANDEDRAVSLAVDEDGNSYVTGYSKSNSTGFDYATIKYDNAGTQQWVKRVDDGSSFDEYARDIAIDESGDVYVTGVFEQTTDNYQLATIKYTPSGTQKWIKKFVNSSGKVSEGNKIVLDGSENIFIGGSVDVSGASNGHYRNFLVVKYSQSQYVIQNRIGIDAPITFSLSQNYPNPFNPVTNIGLRIAHSGFVSLKVFDITGKEVAVLVNNELDAGEYNVSFDASQLASGTYFYRIEAGQFTEVKKMILIK